MFIKHDSCVLLLFLTAAFQGGPEKFGVKII